VFTRWQSTRYVVDTQVCLCDKCAVHACRDARVTALRVAAVAGALCGAVLSGSVRASTEGPRPAAPELTLQIRLTVANGLPPATRATLVREAETIWRRAGVRLQWIAPGEDISPSTRLLPVLVAHLLSPATADEAWPVGRLLPDQSGDRLAIVSIPAAVRVLAAAGFANESPTIAERRLGLVLGRTTAHEIGHYLLRTRNHARRGLMRDQIDAHDFADLRAGSFFLDGAAHRWIRTVLLAGTQAPVLAARFEY
jgi:hypothetical protein